MTPGCQPWPLPPGANQDGSPTKNPPRLLRCRRAARLPSCRKCAWQKNLLQKRLLNFPLVKKSFFRLELPRVQYPDRPAIGSINAENSDAGGRHSQIEKSCLRVESRRIGQQPDGKRILERLFDFALSQRTIQLKRRTIPIELHNELIVNKTPMLCNYNVFTHWR